MRVREARKSPVSPSGLLIHGGIREYETDHAQELVPSKLARNTGPRVHRAHTLEALAVDDRRTALVVLLLGDPHLLEGGQGSQDGTTDPDGVFTLGGSDDLDLHGRGSKSGNFLLHTIGDTRVHGSTTRLGVGQ